MSKLRVAMLSSHSAKGGAAIAAHRIFYHLQKQTTIEPTLITIENSAHSPRFMGWMRRVVRKINSFILKNKNEYLSYNLVGVEKKKLLERLKDYDAICLFWINDSFLSLATIAEITKLNKPILWRLADLWPMTGGCHYSAGCTKYESGCDGCHFFHDYAPPIPRSVLRYKESNWNRRNIIILCPSKWIRSSSQSSKLFKESKHYLLPTGADTTSYHPIQEKALLRQELGIPSDKLIIGIGANNLSEKRKGLSLFNEAIESLKNHQQDVLGKIHLVFFGKRTAEHISASSSFFNYTEDLSTLNRIYNSLDLFVAPSREENLANTVLEAMASGTPCLAFKIGGMSDVITNEEDGYLIEPFNITAVAETILKISQNKSDLVRLGENARKKILSEFTIEKNVELLSKILVEETTKKLQNYP